MVPGSIVRSHSVLEVDHGCHIHSLFGSVEEVIVATNSVRANFKGPATNLRSIEQADGWSVGGRSRHQPVRCHCIALASIEIEDLDPESGSLDDAVEQSLQSDLIDFGLEGVNVFSTVFVQGARQERLVLSRIELHPGARE